MIKPKMGENRNSFKTGLTVLTGLTGLTGPTGLTGLTELTGLTGTETRLLKSETMNKLITRPSPKNR